MSTLKTNTLSNVAGTASTAIENAINGSAKAWVNFNGTGTVAIRASYNVSSITDNGTGDYTLNFTNALADANYAVTGNAGFGTTSNASPSFGIGTLATSSARIFINASTSAGSFDYNFVTVAIFR
jgi:hypothetical protein